MFDVVNGPNKQWTYEIGGITSDNAKVISNIKSLDSNSDMVAVGSTQGYFSVFSRFVYSSNGSLKADNIYSDTPNY